MDAGRLARELHAEREARRAMRDAAEREVLALRLLASRLARLHACIMEVPDGGCGDVDVACTDRGCATCWATWAELEASRVLGLRRRELELEQARAGERRRPVVPEDMDLAGYAEMFGAD